jgi:glutathione S-transferase
MHHDNVTLRLYGSRLSGHSHRAELFLSLLGLRYERLEVDLLGGEQKRTAFLAKNAFGQVPVLEDGELTLADSNAILVYLALRYDSEQRWLPREPAQAGEVQRWLSVAAGPLVAGPGMARLIRLTGREGDLARAQALAAQLFQLLEQQLTGRVYFVGEHATLADLALYSYTALAPEGDVSLAPYPALRGWLARVEALPRFLPVVRVKAS